MYEEQVNLFSSWLHDIDANVADIHEVDRAGIDSALQKLYLSEQEHAERKPTIKNVREKFNAALGSGASQENPLVAQYEGVVRKYEVRVRYFFNINVRESYNAVISCLGSR